VITLPSLRGIRFPYGSLSTMLPSFSIVQYGLLYWILPYLSADRALTRRRLRHPAFLGLKDRN
jgi:hypothetical protein